VRHAGRARLQLHRGLKPDAPTTVTGSKGSLWCEVCFECFYSSTSWLHPFRNILNMVNCVDFVMLSILGEGPPSAALPWALVLLPIKVFPVPM